jgi:anthranilate synthase component 2/para-aminobenzoate synthetase component 2
MILILDNYDSFVFNIVRYCEELGAETRVARNDAVSVDEMIKLNPGGIIISPGPCGPNEAGISLDLIRTLSGRVPILGVCLGHQCIGQAFGGFVTRAERPMHGIASKIDHEGTDVFAGLPNPFDAGRYHSLIVELPKAESVLRVTARSEEGEIMGLVHKTHPTFGVQFHPESVLTQHGHTLIDNFLKIGARRHAYAVA